MKSSTASFLIAIGGWNGVDVNGQTVVKFAGHFWGHGGLDRVVGVGVLLLHTMHKLHQHLLNVCGQKQALAVRK